MHIKLVNDLRGVGLELNPSKCELTLNQSHQEGGCSDYNHYDNYFRFSKHDYSIHWAKLY